MRSPDTPGRDRTCSESFGVCSKADRHPAREGEVGLRWESRMLPSMHELTQCSLVPSCSYMDQNHHSWAGATAIAALAILIGWSVHDFYSGCLR